MFRSAWLFLGSRRLRISQIFKQLSHIRPYCGWLSQAAHDRGGQNRYPPRAQIGRCIQRLQPMDGLKHKSVRFSHYTKRGTHSVVRLLSPHRFEEMRESGKDFAGSSCASLRPNTQSSVRLRPSSSWPSLFVRSIKISNRVVSQAGQA